MAISLVSGLDIGNFKYMQTVNKIKPKEREIPSEKAMLARTRERLQVKVEHEMLAIPAPQIAFLVDRLIPVVEAMSESREGRRDLAAICAAYLKEHRPQTSPDGTEPENSGDEGASAEDEAANTPPRKSRREGGDRSKRRSRRPRR